MPAGRVGTLTGMTFDPSKTTEHTVDEVVDAVAAHPGIAGDVLAVERARIDREPRVTLIEKIEALPGVESTQDAGDGDPAPDAENGAQGQPGAGSGDPDGTERIGEATGEPRTEIAVAPGETATLTGDGTPGQEPVTTGSRWGDLYSRATALDAGKRAEFDRLMDDGTDWSDLPTSSTQQDEFERRLVTAEAYEAVHAPAPPVDDGMSASRVTPDVKQVNMTQESVMAGDPMTDENRGSQPVSASINQPGMAPADDGDDLDGDGTDE